MDKLKTYLASLSNRSLIRLRRQVFKHDLCSLHRDYRRMCEIIEDAIDAEFISRIGQAQR